MAWSYHAAVLSGKLCQAVRKATKREVVSSRMANAQKPGDRLQRYSGRSTNIYVSTPWRTPRTQPSRRIRKYPKRYPSTSRRMTSRGSHQSSPAQQVR